MTDNEVKWLIMGKLLRRNLMAVKGEQWEVLFEGTVETVAESGTKNSADIPLLYSAVSRNESVRLTIDGDTRIYTVEYGLMEGGKNAGNKSLYGVSSDDDGYDLHVAFGTSTSTASHVSTRTAGAHTVKIERKVAKEPVAYLYNGVRLPKLPQSELPYAYITVGENAAYEVTFCSSPLYAKDTNNPYIYGANLSYVVYGTDGKSDFEQIATGKNDSEVYMASINGDVLNIIWCNTDILIDGTDTVRFSTSEPVPVYE